MNISVIGIIASIFAAMMILTPIVGMIFFIADAIWPERVSCRKRPRLMTDAEWQSHIKITREFSALWAAVGCLGIFLCAVPFWAMK